jgi:hypothetical protein
MDKTIDEQLAGVRSSLRRQRLFNVALVAVAGVAGTVIALRPAGDASFDSVRCHRWLLIDADGKERIVASSLATGQAGMTWIDTNGKARMAAGTQADGIASMAWIDADGQKRVAAGTQPDGFAGLSLMDKEGKVRIASATQPTGTAGSSMFDKDGNERIAAAIDADGAVTLPTKDAKQ